MNYFHAVKSFFDETKITSSTLKKVEIAEKFIKKYDGTLAIDIVNLYLNKDITFGFSSKQINKADNFGRSGNKKLTIMGFLTNLSNRAVTGNDAIEDFNELASRIDEDELFVLTTILTRESVGIDTKLFNKAYKKVHGASFIDKFQPQLANKYNTTKNYGVSHWYASPKLDGIRCVYRNGNLETRNGKAIVGFDDIVKVCDKIAKMYKIDIIDGELYSHELGFQEIQGYVVRNKNVNPKDKEKIFFNVFAVISHEEEFNTEEMVNALSVINKTDPVAKANGCVRIVPYIKVNNNWADIEKATIAFVEQGYEGMMLRHPEVSYMYKRSNDLLKVKFFEEDDFIVTGFTPGTGKNKGTLGAISVKSKDGSIVSNVGTGLSDEMRDYIWNHQDEYLGKLAEIKYQGITDDGSSLRFPVWTNKLKLDR